MTNELFAGLLLFLGGVLAAVLYVLDRSGKRLADSIPAEVMPLLFGLLDLADRLADTTPTLDDDALVERLREALYPAPDAPTVDPDAQG